MVYVLVNRQNYSDYLPSPLSSALSLKTVVTDPMGQAVIKIGDVGSAFNFAIEQEVVLVDDLGLSNPTHNLLINPSILTSGVVYFGYAANNPSGGSIVANNPGFTFTLNNNGTGNCLEHQVTQRGYIIPGQQYMLSAYIDVTVTISGASGELYWNWLDAGQNFISGGGFTSWTTTSGVQKRLSCSATAPPGAVYADVYVGYFVSSGTNSGTMTVQTMQFEPMWLTSAGVAYPTPDCNASQTNCVQLPDFTTVRESRLFAGYITKIDLIYNGPNRIWTLTCASNSLLLETFFLASKSYEGSRDDLIIDDIVQNNYTAPMQTPSANGTYQIIATSGVITGTSVDYLTLADLTFREVLNTLSGLSGNYFYVDPYFTLWYAAPGFQQAAFGLSDAPNASPTDGSLPTYSYYSYQLTIDGTQLKNRVKVIGGHALSGPITDNFTGDGSTKNFLLSQIPGLVSTVTVAGVSKTRIGVAGQDTLSVSVPVVYDKYSPAIKFNTAPGNGQAIAVTYQYDQTVVVRSRDMGSIQLYNQTFDSRLSDSGLVSIADAATRGLAELLQYSTPRLLVRLTTQQQLFAGQQVQFSSALDGYSKFPLFVQDSTLVLQAGGLAEWQCNLGGYNPNLGAVLHNIHKAMNRNTNVANLPILEEHYAVFDSFYLQDRATGSVLVPLSLYGITTASSTLSSANRLATSTGGSTANANTKNGVSVTGYGEIYSQGTATTWPAGGSLGSPSGHGFLYDTTALEGHTLQAGTYTANFHFKVTAGTATVVAYARVYKYNSGVYTSIGSFSSGSLALTTTSTLYSWTGSLSSMAFGVGDKLYLDVWFDETVGDGSTNNFDMPQGVTNGAVGFAELDTPGYI